MAGQPQKRLRQLTATLKENGIDPATLGSNAAATPRPTPAGMEDLTPRASRARAPATSTPPPTRPSFVGPQTRHESDRRNASELSELAEKLPSGMSLRLERTRPTWAAGWVEDVMIDDHDLASVMDYIHHEHGGQMYRATVIGVDGAALYTARLPVAGPPRRRGRIEPRSYWDGSDPEPRASNPIAHAQPTHATPPAFDLKSIVDLIGQVMNQGRERQDTLVDSVREMNAQNQATTTKLLTAVMQRDERERQSGGLRDQLRELVQAKQAFEEVQEVLGVAPQQQHGNDENEDAMSAVMKEAAVGIIRQGLQNDASRAAPPPTQPRQPPPGFRRVQPQPTNGHAQPKAPPQ